MERIAILIVLLACGCVNADYIGAGPGVGGYAVGDDAEEHGADDDPRNRIGAGQVGADDNDRKHDARQQPVLGRLHAVHLLQHVVENVQSLGDIACDDRSRRVAQPDRALAPELSPVSEEDEQVARPDKAVAVDVGWAAGAIVTRPPGTEQ